MSSDTQQSIIPSATDYDPSCIAVVIFPDGITGLRKQHKNLFDAKIWLTEKVWMHKLAGDSDTFPFGFEYLVLRRSEKEKEETEIILKEELNLA